MEKERRFVNILIQMLKGVGAKTLPKHLETGDMAYYSAVAQNKT